MSKYTYRNQSKTYFFNTCFDKNQLKNLISWFIKQSGEKVTVDFLEILKQIGFHQATLAGVSLGLEDLQIPSQKSLLISQAKADVSLFEQQIISGNLTSVEKSQRMISTWNQTSEILRKTAVHQFKTTNPVNPVYMMAFSGARGNISQVRQLVAMRGLMADPQGVILEFPIQSNFREGLTLTEYLISCYGARKGLVDTALRTATSGYLTRRLVDAAQHVIVSLKDCGTTQGFRLRNKDLEQHLIGRFLSKDLIINQKFCLKRNQKISPRLAKVIAKTVKEVFVRSPLTCESENSICQLCYGLNLAHGNLVSIGEAVGVIAAQSIGEPGTQLTMRTFHTGGVGVFSDQSMKYFFSPYDGIIEYPEGLPGHFVRTPHGKIVYMVKNTTNISQHLILKLKSLQTKEIYFSLKKQDLPPGSLLLVRQGEYVKTGQVVAQAAHFKKSKQKMPESTHPVFSTLDGEIYLESMTILKQKQLDQKTKKTKKSQKKETEIGPDIRTLKGLGNFWVLSANNQQEFHSAKTILRSGDLVSSKTSLFQYDFYVRNRGVFHNISNKSALGLNSINLPIEKINFHKLAYSLLLKNTSRVNKQYYSNQKQLLFFNQKRFQNFLIWSPNLENRAQSGYFLNFLFYSEIKNKRVLTSPLVFNKSNKSLNNNWFNGSFFYIPKNLKKSTIKFQFGGSVSKKTKFFWNKTSFFWKEKSWIDFDLFSRSFFHSEKEQEKTTQHLNMPNYFLNLKNCGDLEKYSLLQCNPRITPVVNKKQTIKTKFLYCKQKRYLIDSCLNIPSNFVKKSLKKVKYSYYNLEIPSLVFQEKKGWIYVSTNKKLINKFQTNKKLLISEQGKKFDNLLFLNSKICIEYIPTNKIGVFKELKNTKFNENNWYCPDSFLEQNFLQNKNKTNSIYLNFAVAKTCSNISKNSFKCFVYYKLEKHHSRSKKESLFQKTLFFGTERKTNLTGNLQNQSGDFLSSKIFTLTQWKKVSQTSIKDFFFVYSLKELALAKKRDLSKQWSGLKKVDTTFGVQSVLFTKQHSTGFQKHQKLTKDLQLLVSISAGWFSSKNIFKVLINFNSQLIFKKVNHSYLIPFSIRNHKIPIVGINLFLYNFISLPQNISFCFEIFENNFVTPNNKLTTGFIKIKKSGEFRRFKSTKNNSIACILTNQNLITLDLSKFLNTNNDKKNLNKNKQIQIGNVLRSGTEIFPEIASSIGGLLLNKDFNHLTIRLGVPFLASARGIIHVFQSDLIQKNDLLVTLKSRRLQTQDIVQGIPKIEQLFEARETQGGSLIRNSVHTRLKKYFISSLKSEKFSTNIIHINLSQALTESLKKIQFFLVQSILQAYSSQGVKISQKHIEIIVRQMTTRVRILAGGDSGLLPGELIHYTRIQKLNQQLYLLGKRPAIYEPLILGITKSVLQSESFLLSASFQEVSRVLVRSALNKKTDFLRGLHENVILGQLVPTGTGLVSTRTKKIEN